MPRTPTVLTDLIGSREAQRLTGASWSRLESAVARGKLTLTTVAGRPLFSRAEVLAWDSTRRRYKPRVPGHQAPGAPIAPPLLPAIG